jgi:hypothetical protein
MLPQAAVVHSDDVAWARSRFGWADLMIAGVLDRCVSANRSRRLAQSGPSSVPRSSGWGHRIRANGTAPPVGRKDGLIMALEPPSTRLS